MPNWCDNSVSITGTEESLRQLEQDIREAKGLCEAILPTPPELLAISAGVIHYDAQGNADAEWNLPGQTTMSKRTLSDEDKEILMEKYGAVDWYDWNVKFRGSKWAVDLDEIHSDVEVDERNGVFSMYLHYQSAWAPNLEVSVAILEREGITHINHDYIERGCDFCGEATGDKDETTGEIVWTDDCRDEITFADLVERDEIDDYVEVEVKDLLVYLGDKPFGAFINKDEKWMEVLPFGLNEIICLNVAPDTGKGMISEYEQEEYIRDFAR
jgi:hypothetical protein